MIRRYPTRYGHDDAPSKAEPKLWVYRKCDRVPVINGSACVPERRGVWSGVLGDLACDRANAIWRTHSTRKLDKRCAHRTDGAPGSIRCCFRRSEKKCG